MAKIGRPTIYDPEIYVEPAFEYARAGLTNTEIADKLGIATCTLHDWRDKYPEFSDAIKTGKETPNDNVEKSLYKRAMGYEVVETKEFKDTKGNITRTETTIKHIAGDVGAQCMWLKNRRPKEWMEKLKHELTGADGKDFTISLTTADFKKKTEEDDS